MLTLKGTSRNINKPLLGRISFLPVEDNNKSTAIIINPALTKNGLEGYVASIFSHANTDHDLMVYEIPTVYNVSNIDFLSEGDVVEIFPNGAINVLYQINSKHNQIFVTSRCNSNCIMCPQPIDHHERNLTELNLKLISLMDKSISELAFNGGEPTLIGYDFFRLILACKDFLPDTALLLLTNGRKFSDFNYTHRYSSLCHPNITVSTPIYGDNDIEHDFIVGAKGSFNETVMGILNLASFGHPIEIRTVIHKYTYKNLLKISEYLYRNMTFVKHIAFMGMETTWRAKKNLELLWVEPIEIIHPLEEAVHHLVQRGMDVSIYNIPLCLLPKQLWTFARQSISDWKNSFESKCLMCSVKNQCSGMFDSGVSIYREYLEPIDSLSFPE